MKDQIEEIKKLEKIQDILNKKLVGPDGLTFCEILEKLEDPKSEAIEVESRLLSLVESKQDSFNELFDLVCGDVVNGKITNNFKLGILCRFLLNMVKSQKIGA